MASFKFQETYVSSVNCVASYHIIHVSKRLMLVSKYKIAKLRFFAKDANILIRGRIFYFLWIIWQENFRNLFYSEKKIKNLPCNQITLKVFTLYVEIKCQLDVTEVFIADLTACSTCFGHHYAHHQELKNIIQWLLPVVFCAVVFQVAGLMWSWGLCVRFAGCCSILQTGHITLNSTPDQLLEKPQHKIPQAATTV